MVHTKLITKVIDLCLKSAKSAIKSKHAALVYTSKNNIIGKGTCNIRTRGFGISILPSYHAEASALENAFGSRVTSFAMRNYIKVA